MKSRRTMMLAGLALVVPFLVPTVGTADDHEPTLYVSSTSGGKVDGVWFADEDILAHDLVNGGWERYFDGSDVGLRGNDLNAFHIGDDGTILMALKKPQRVGGFWADDSDVIAFFPTSLGKQTAGTFEKVFDGSDVGLSTYAEEIDALAVTPDERLLLSTSGSLKVPRTGGGSLWGADEDLIVFNAESLGTQTAGSFERYFDGSDVGLRSSSEDVWGAWIDPFSGDVVMTTKSYYKVPGLRGDKEDVIVFSPDSLGYRTTGTFSPGWDGDEHGLSGEYLDGLSVDPGQQQTEDRFFQASLTNDWVQGWGYEPGTSVSVRIFDFLGLQQTELFSGDAEVDGDGYFYLGPEHHGIDLMPGTYIEVDGRSLEMEELSFDVFDPENDVLRGTAPEGTVVEVGGGNDDGGFGGTTVAGGDGKWVVDLMTEEFGNFDLQPDMGAQAWVSDDDGDQTIAEPRFVQFQASLTSNWVQGWNFTPGASVAVEIFDLSGVSVFTGSPLADGQGNFNVNDLLGVDLVPGMRITVDDGTLDPRELVLEDLTFTEFDVDGDIIGGMAPVGAFVGFGGGIEGYGFDGQVEVTDGTWSVELNTEQFGFFDLQQNMGAQAWVSDDDGDQTVAEPPPLPQFQASLTSDWVSGWNFTPNSSVDVEIFEVFGGTSQFTASAPTDGQGNFNVNDLSGLDLVPGMYVTVADSLLPLRELVLEPITFDEFDIDTDTIGGTATAGATVEFGVGNEDGGPGGQIVATDGTWSVDLSADPYNFDLTGDMGGQAWINDDDGDQTVAEPPPLPQFQASLTSDWVSGWNFTPNSSVDVEIFEVFGGSSQFTASAPTDGQGNFNVDDLSGVDLVPGVYVTVADSLLPLRELVLENLTFETFDFLTDTIGGTATAGATVEFDVGTEFNGVGGQVTADGSWTVDLSAAAYNFDLTGAMGGQARISDADGDQTVAEPRFAQFQASLTGNWLSGWNFTPGSPVTVEVFMSSSDPVALFTYDGVTDSDGNFNLGDLGDVVLMPDMYITVDDVDNDNDKTLTLVPLTFVEFDASSNRLAGEAPTGTLVDFNVGNEFGGTGGQVIAEGSGFWSVNTNTEQFGFFDLLPSMGNGQARVYDDDGDQTVADLQVPQFQASLSGDWLQGGGFAPNSPVTVEVYENLVGQFPGTQLFPPPDPPAPDPITTGDDGSFGLDIDPYGFELMAGNYIKVTVAGTTKTLVTVPLTFETFDVGTNVIGGFADPGTYVEFGVGNDEGGLGGVAIADGTTGEWSVNLLGQYGFDLTDTMGGQAWVSDFDLDQTVADAPPPPGEPVDVTVSDQAGSPVPGAIVDVLQAAVPVASDSTDSAGTVQFLLDTGVYDLTVTPQAGSGLASVDVDDVVVSGPEQIDIVLLAEMPSLSGRLLDPVGSPVAGGRVDFEPGGVKLVTDADGEFVFEAEAGVYSFEITTYQATRNGRPLPSGWMVSSVDLTSGDVTADLTLPFFEFDVRVLKADGTPAGTDYGARVVGSSEFDAGSGYTLTGTWQSGTGAGTGNLDGNGELQLHGYGTVSGEVTVQVYPPGSPTIVTTATLTPDTTIVVELADVPSLSGRLLDPVGSPVAGGRVDFEPGGVKLVTDADGEFVFEAEAGVYSFEITTYQATRNGRPLPSGWMVSSVDLTSGDVTADLTLPFFEFDVRVLKADGTPAGTDYGARVVGSSEFDAGSGYTLTGTWQSGTGAGTGNLDGNGELQLHGYGTVSGEVTVQVYPPGSPTIVTTATLTPDTTIVVELADVPSLSGRLLDPVGSPVAGGRVDFEPGGVKLVTDADGEFVFEAEAGVYSFEITTYQATRNGRPLPSGWMVSSVDLTSGDVTADLTLPFFEFDVRVLKADGTPAGTDYGARVVGSSEFDAGSGYTLTGTWQSGTGAGTGNLDGNGELQLHGYGTVSGEVTVQVYPPGSPTIVTTATLTPNTTIVVVLAGAP